MNLVIATLIFFFNAFRKKKLSYESIGNAYLVYESQFDKNIFDYCSYIKDGLLKELPNIRQRSIFFKSISAAHISLSGDLLQYFCSGRTYLSKAGR